MARKVALLPLWEVLALRGTRSLASGRGLEIAVERCSECPDPGRCRRFIAAGHHGTIEAFCPNAMYLRHLDAMHRHAPKKDLLG